jgi:dienelactone hydrolase
VNNRITIEGRDGAFVACIARPKALPAPAVVVLHEVFGVTVDVRRTCDELTGTGRVDVLGYCLGGPMTFLTAAPVYARPCRSG